MKKILYIMNALLVTLLASCSEEINEMEFGKYEATIEAVANYAMAGDDAMTATEPNSRAATDVDRYVIEVYTDADCTQAANVFKSGTANKAANTTGSFVMTLGKEKSYYCLLWADSKASAVYDVSSLKAVSLRAGVTPAEAFHGKLTISKAQSTYSVALKRAVANIVLKETGKLAAGELVMKFSQKASFDVSKATATGTATGRTEKITIDQPITGTKDTPATINTEAIFVLAPAAAAEKMNVVFKYAAEAEFTVADVQLQANYRTNITGHYGPPPLKDYALGELYPDAQKPIGVVFWLDASDASYDSTTLRGTKGKIVSLNEETSKTWCPNNMSPTGATDSENGLANMRTVKAQGNTFANYPAFEAAYNLNPSTTDYADGSTGVWYLPARNELIAVYTWWNANGAGRVPNNKIIQDAGGVDIQGSYWSSSEVNDGRACFCIDFTNSGFYYNGFLKSYEKSVRCISAF